MTVTRRQALVTLIEYAAGRVSPDAANGVQVVRREDRNAVLHAVEKLFAEAHGRPMETTDYETLQLDDRRDVDDAGDSEIFVAKTTFERMAQIGSFALYEVTHNEGGGRGVTLHASVITWARDRYDPRRWFAELYAHNTLKQDRDRDSHFAKSEYRYPWSSRIELAEELMRRVQQHAAEGSDDFRPSCGVYAEGESEEEALQMLQSVLERSRLSLFHHRTGNTGRL